MKTSLIALVSLFQASLSFSQFSSISSNLFIENKGQIKDQHGNVRQDIDFVLPCDGINIFIGKGKLEYQMNHADTFYRMEAILKKSNSKAELIKEAPQAYYETYYTSGLNGLVVKSYQRITYKNIYPGIDWTLYPQNNSLEYEFSVSKNADPSQIKIEYLGATDLKLNLNGDLIATTPLGTVSESAPITYLSSGTIFNSSYVLQENTLQFNLAASNKSLVIDPSVRWATYYGSDTGFCYTYTAVADKLGHINMCGITKSATSIATVGAYQSTISSTATEEAFIVQFDTSGKRIWGTYFGGNANDKAVSLSIDSKNNIYLVGQTFSSSGIATPGVEQTVLSGSYDGYLAKFTSLGALRWATYCGGNRTDVLMSSAVDTLENVYVTGMGTSTDKIATPGSFKDSYTPSPIGTLNDVYLLKYDSTGKRIWGTYIGGNSDETSYSIATLNHQVFLTGWTKSKTGIASPSAFKTTCDSMDAFILCFDSSGSRKWGTYYGGSIDENGVVIGAGQDGSVYVVGGTSSNSGIATPGAWQTTLKGFSDAYLVKFDTSGTRIWCTYYGGNNSEAGPAGGSLNIEEGGDIYFAGLTTSTNGMATSDAFDSTLNGPDDAFIVGFRSNGTRFYGSYFGGEGKETGHSVISDKINLYLAGSTNSSTGIATAGSFKPSYTIGDYNAYLVKFGPSIPSQVSTSQALISNFEVFPNPSQGKFTLSGIVEQSSRDLEFQILNIAGKVIMNEHAAINAGRVNHEFKLYETLAAGVYLLKITQGNHEQIIRLIKE